MTKGLKLMTNLLKDYFSEVPGERWHQFAASLSSQLESLTDLIKREEGPRRKKNAQEALDILTAALQERSLLTDEVAA